MRIIGYYRITSRVERTGPPRTSIPHTFHSVSITVLLCRLRILSVWISSCVMFVCIAPVIETTGGESFSKRYVAMRPICLSIFISGAHITKVLVLAYVKDSEDFRVRHTIGRRHDLVHDAI